MTRNVVIVGGGSAGWMTAAYLRAAFGDRVEITVVESPRIATIGVGEATFSTIRHFFAFLGLAERDWMPACHATYKLGIRFENWREPGHHFYHPFERLRVVDGFSLADWWLQQRPSSHFDSDCFVIPALGEAGCSPRHLDGRLFEDDLAVDGERPSYRTTLADQGTQFPYAYHFDAALLAEYLADYATRRGVRRVLDDVLSVELDQRGAISHLLTKDHGQVGADLFVDCTGFRGLLLASALGEPFESYQDSLPNDRAVALRVPADTADRVGSGMRPCTTATAMPAGWIWTIPLNGRIGTGYVYASDYCTEDEAERDLRAFVGPAAEGLEANHIRMRIGRSRNSWVKNCVGIGLSSGFVEPLESTGIFFIQYAIEQLVQHFPSDGEAPALRDAYNRVIGRCLDGVREFLVLHYRGAARADNAYWRDAKHRAMPEGLADRLERWQLRLPDVDTIYPYYHGFEPYSYVCMLMGLGGVPLRPSSALRLLDDRAAVREFRRIGERSRALVEQLPSQGAYFAALAGASPAAVS